MALCCALVLWWLVAAGRLGSSVRAPGGHPRSVAEAGRPRKRPRLAAPLTHGDLLCIQALLPEIVPRVVALLPPLVAAATHQDGGTMVQLWPGSAGSVREVEILQRLLGVRFIPGGERLLTRCMSTSFSWDLDPLRQQIELTARDGFLLKHAEGFPDGQRLAFLHEPSIDKGRGLVEVFVWNGTSGEQLQRIRFAEYFLSGQAHMRVLAPGDRIVTAYGSDCLEGGNATVSVWSASSGAILRRWRTPGSLYHFEVSPCGRKLVTASTAPSRRTIAVVVWDAPTGAQERSLTVRKRSSLPPLLHMGVSNSGAKLVMQWYKRIDVLDMSSEERTTISVWRDAESFLKLFEILVDGRRMVVLRFGRSSARDGQSGVAQVMVWDLQLVQVSVQFDVGSLPASPIWSLVSDWAVSPDGSSFALCAPEIADGDDLREHIVNRDRVVRVWDIASGRLLHRWARRTGANKECLVAVASIQDALWESAAQTRKTS